MTDEIKALSLKIRQLNIEIQGLKNNRYRADKIRQLRRLTKKKYLMLREEKKA
jgi:hypothetical protein